MSTSDLLFELGTEELPAGEITAMAEAAATIAAAKLIITWLWCLLANL